MHRGLHRQRFTGRHTFEVGVSPATVSRGLRRAGLSRLKDFEPSRSGATSATIPAR